MDETQRKLVRNYPLAASLTPSYEVINGIPPPAPYPPSLFPLSAGSLVAGPEEALFSQYATELDVLLSSASLDAEQEAWRQSQLDRVVAEVGEEVDALRGPAYGGFRFPPPPEFPPAADHFQMPPVPPVASHLLAALDFPCSPVRTAAPPPPPMDPAAAQAFFHSTLAGDVPQPAATKPLSSQSPGSGIFPSASQRSQPAPPAATALSSPDPLRMGTNPRSLPTSQTASQRQTTPDDSLSPKSRAFVSPKRSPKSSFVIEVPPSTSKSRALLHSLSKGGKMTESQKAKARQVADETPEPDLGDGFESAVKKIKLVSGSMALLGSGTSANSSGRGFVKNGGTADLVEKFSDLVSDIFSADDASVGDTSSTHMADRSPSRNNRNYFRSTATSPDNLPLIRTDTLEKIIKQLKVLVDKDKGEDLFADLEENGFQRLLRLVERSWKGVEDIKFWDSDALKAKPDSEAAPSPGKKKQQALKKGKGKAVSRRAAEVEDDEDNQDDEYDPDRPREASTSNERRSSRSRSRSPAIPRAATPADVEMPDAGDAVWNEETVLHFQRSARNVSDALLAIHAALLLLTCTRLPKQLYGADYIASFVTVLRAALTDLVVPLLEAPVGSHLDDLASEQYAAVKAVVDALTSSFAPLCDLLRQEELSEDLVTSLVVFSLEPFFHEAPPMTGRGKKPISAVSKAMTGIRTESLGLVRTVLGRYPDQRSWAVQEVLDKLKTLAIAKKGKGGFPLRNGTSIHTVSALILHLIQTVPDDMIPSMRARISSDQGPKLVDVVMRESHEDDEEDELAIKRKNDLSTEDGSMLTTAAKELLLPVLDASTSSARLVMSYLLQRSCKTGKSSAGSVESEYRAVLDNLMADLLSTLHLPEWPAAEVLLTMSCRLMIATLADPKTGHELNALKGVSLDHLGPIAARIQQDQQAVASLEGPLSTLQEVFASDDVDAMNQVFSAEVEVLAHLSRTAKSASTDGATRFSIALFARELVQAAQTAANKAAQLSEARLGDSKEGLRSKLLAERLEELAKEIWTTKLAKDDVFGPTADNVQPRIDSLALQLSRSQPLASLYDMILQHIVSASDTTVVSFRTKALKSISLLVAGDPSLFLSDDIRTAVTDRMCDQSPAVRDSALELVGKYVLKRQDLAVQYLPQIAERISDTGLSVRRRAIKLLKALFSVVESRAERVEICRRLVNRVNDEDDGIKELAVDAIEDLWFSRTSLRSIAAPSEGVAAESGTSQLASIIREVTGGERAPPVDAILRLIIAKHAEKNTIPPTERLRELTESLIDDLLEDLNPTPQAVVECTRTVFVLSSADPALLAPGKASQLLPFLKSSSTPAEQITSDYLLRIFRGMVTSLPKGAHGSSKFSRDLQASLLAMVNRPPPSANTSTLQEIVACLCAVINGQTHDFSRLLAVFKACVAKLVTQTRTICDPDPATAATVRPQSLPMICYLTALLCEHGGFDKLRLDYPETRPELDQITKSSLSHYVFSILIKLHNTPLAAPAQGPIRASLGFLYRSYPTLMTESTSTAILDVVLRSPDLNARLQLLRVFQDFLASQSKPELAPQVGKGKADKGVKIEELVGNVEGFADSGVASAIAQRYISEIINSALSTHQQIQRVAVDILCSVARSGFSHPLTVAPPLMALSGCPDGQTASKAYATLAILHQKHASLLATRYLDSVRMVHRYATTNAQALPVHGYSSDPPVSYLARWYGLLKEKRQSQLDFLKSLSRSFEIDLDKECSENDVSFARFVAEALSTLEFRRAEEPMLIIHQLNKALAVSGLEVLHSLQEGLEGGGGLMAGLTPLPPSPVRSTKLKRNGSHSPDKRGFNVSPSTTPAPEPVLIDLHTEDGSTPPSGKLARQSLISGVALLLRDHLKQLYSISEKKLEKYDPGKKTSAGGDKPVAVSPDAAVALGQDKYQRLPLILVSMNTAQLLTTQRTTYIDLIANDGTIGREEDPDDDET